MPQVMIETIGLAKSFRARKAVDDLSLRVFEGDIYGFLGPNGAGKSTTIRLLTGLVRPSAGSARLMGHDVSAHRLSALREVGALVESPTFYRYLSARQNLRVFSQLSGGCPESRIDDVLHTVGLYQRADDKVKTYSHGMLQRLGIAQALLPNPRLIILDEPTIGLDPRGMKDIRELIVRLARDHKVTVFLSSHLLYEVEQICTRVGVIDKGKLIAEGEVRDLLTSDLETIEFRVSNVPAAADLLSGLEWAEVLPPPAGHSDGPESVLARMPGEMVPAAVRALVNAGAEVSAVLPRSVSLEQLFLELTGEPPDAH